MQIWTIYLLKISTKKETHNAAALCISLAGWFFCCLPTLQPICLALLSGFSVACQLSDQNSAFASDFKCQPQQQDVACFPIFSINIKPILVNRCNTQFKKRSRIICLFINYDLFVFMSVLRTWSSCIITQYGSLILLHSENGRSNLSDRYCFVNALTLSEFISKTFEQLPAIVTHCWRFALINSSISWMIMEADMLKLRKSDSVFAKL